MNEIPHSVDGVFDAHGTMNRLGGDRELFADLVVLFFEDSEKLLTTLQNEFDRGDLRAMERPAHTLKSLCANFGAERAVRLAAEIEDTAPQGDAAQIRAALESLEAAVGQLRQCLAPYRRESNTATS